MNSKLNLALPRLLDRMWNDYVELNPGAKKIHSALAARGEKVQNDHIAFRTIRHPKLGIDQLANPFMKLGYQKKNHYEFKEKKLSAFHYEHADENFPKLFISELLLDACSGLCQEIFHRLIETIPDEIRLREDFSCIGRPWELRSEAYLTLAAESEYAGWVAAHGFRPNHFTVLVNSLKTFASLSDLNGFIKSLGFTLNSSGGEIKGSQADFLEQSSTLAEPVLIRFADRELAVPACYYEFAERHPMPDGKLYPGFVAASADKIFESTDRN